MKLISSTCKLIVLFFAVFSYYSCSSDESETTPTEEEITIPDDTCDEGKVAVFVEKDELVIVEVEKAVFKSTDWRFDNSLSGYSGEGYLVWDGPDSFSQPGTGMITYKIRISNPGTYRFLWQSRITSGSSNTDFNDNWLRIPDANHFYGRRNSDGNIVYPKGTQLPPIPESDGQTTTDPEGAGSDGWFKIYMNTVGSWHWQSSTSDNNPHDIYAVFDTAGDYTIEISGRSNGHGIDKFVLFTENITQDDATATNASESEIKCE